MSLGPLRYYSNFLYQINATTYPSAIIDNAPFILLGGGAGSFIGFPIWMGVYPIPTEINSFVLEWTIQTMPTNGTYVELVPFSLKGFINTGTLVPGYYNEDATNLGTAAADESRYSFDFLDATNNYVPVKNYYLRKTTADGTTGTTHVLNIGSPYVAFFLLSDGDAATGSHSLYAHLSHR